MPPSQLVVMQLVMRHDQHHKTPTCVETAGEYAVVASASRAMKEHSTNKEDVTHDSHRRIDGQHYYYNLFSSLIVLLFTIICFGAVYLFTWW